MEKFQVLLILLVYTTQVNCAFRSFWSLGREKQVQPSAIGENQNDYRFPFGYRGATF